MKNKVTHTIRIIWYAFLLIIAAFVLGTICYIHLLLPTPEYKVSTYPELSAALAKNPELVIPAEDSLPSEPTYLTVYVPRRLRSSPKAGYRIDMDIGSVNLYVDCRTLDSYTGSGQEIPEFLANQCFGQMPVEVLDSKTTMSITFQSDTCQYSIIANGRNSILAQEVKDITVELAQSLISQILS